MHKLCEFGHHVDYYCSGEFEKVVNESGASLIAYDDKLTKFLNNYKPTDRHPFFMLMEHMIFCDKSISATA